jgi:CysZ protein
VDALRGIGLILTRPRLWPLCLAPTGVAVAVYWLAAWWLLAHPPAGLEEGWQRFLFTLIVLVGLALLSVVVFSAFIGVIFDPLSCEIEREVDGVAPPPCPQTWSELMADSLRRLGFNTLLGLLAFVLGFLPVVGLIAAVVLTGIIGVLDYTSVAYLRRGKTFSLQRHELLKKPDRPTLLFGALVGLAALVPGLGLLLAPGFIAGGTLLARRTLAQKDY